MRAKKTLLILATALLIVGAGCESSPTNSNTNSGSLALPPSASEASNVNASEDTKPAATETKVDDTWKTYTNAALGFSFKWPTTGRYAPKWDATFAKESDARIKDGCLTSPDATIETVTVGGVSFCHTWTESKDGASATDYYVTKKGGQYVVLTFVKKKDAFKDYSWTDYRAGLGQIVATYSDSK